MEYDALIHYHFDTQQSKKNGNILTEYSVSVCYVLVVRDKGDSGGPKEIFFLPCNNRVKAMPETILFLS
jgi:hypothetical protein